MILHVGFMTLEEKRNKMIDEGRIILNPIDFIFHYISVFSIVLLNLLMVILAWNQTPSNPNNATLTNRDIIIWTIVDIILMIGLYSFQREKLSIKKQSTDLQNVQILEVVQHVGKEFEWLPNTFSKDFIQADFHRVLGTSSRISIFIREKEIHINCRAMYGQFPGFVKQNKIAEAFLSALRMKSYELNHQKKKVES